MSGKNDHQPVDVIAELARAQVLLHPARLRILEMLAEPGSAASLARRIDEPRQRLNYHLRELETHGFVELVAERRRGSVTERIYRRSGDGFAISIEALGALGARPEAVRDRSSSAYRVAMCSQAVADLATLRSGAEAAGRSLATFGLDVEVRFADAHSRSSFAQELADGVAALVRKYHDDQAPGGERFRFHMVGHPAPADAPS